ncbi:DUF58 domain-containing protein [Trueperella sp. LYQ143]|uniref:DUF58 domain-containing protein n=1 Tax=unclassified Trueperella TaxID=2630174 RepID=UPI003983BE52
MFIRPLAVALSGCGIVLAGIVRDAGWALLLTVILAVAVCLDVLCAPSPSHVYIDDEMPASTRVGQSTPRTLILSHTGRSTIRGMIRDAWPPSGMLSPSRHSFVLSPGQRSILHSTLRPQRRGTLHSSAITIRTYGPLHLAGRQQTVSTSWQLRILPEFISRKNLPSRLQQLRELGGRSLLLVRGEGTEFDSLREYVAGDDVRAIDWRSTARRGQTLVRTWRPERDRHVIIVLDCGRGGAIRINDHPAFDAFIETSLLEGALAQKAGDRVSILAIDDQVRARLTGENSSRLIHRMGEVIADVEPSLRATDWSLLPTYIRELGTQPAFIIITTTLNGGTVSSGLLDVLPILRQRHSVMIAAATDSSSAATSSEQQSHNANLTVDDAYERAAYERSRVENANLTRILENSGAHVVRADADCLPTAVVDRYIALKAHGKL